MEKNVGERACVDSRVTRRDDEGHSANRELHPIPFSPPSQILEPLMLMYKSLVSTGQRALATGPLVDSIRRVGCFGICLAPLDLRQVGTHALVVFVSCDALVFSCPWVRAFSLVHEPRTPVSGKTITSDWHICYFFFA